MGVRCRHRMSEFKGTNWTLFLLKLESIQKVHKCQENSVISFHVCESMEPSDGGQGHSSSRKAPGPFRQGHCCSDCIRVASRASELLREVMQCALSVCGVSAELTVLCRLSLVLCSLLGRAPPWTRRSRPARSTLVSSLGSYESICYEHFLYSPWVPSAPISGNFSHPRHCSQSEFWKCTRTSVSPPVGRRLQ